jgi:hypothetical protein
MVLQSQPVKYLRVVSCELYSRWLRRSARTIPTKQRWCIPKKTNVPTGRHYEGGWGAVDNGSRTEMGDSGSAARFFYCAKASKKDRNEGLDGFPMSRKREADRMR